VHINLSRNNISSIERGAFENCVNITNLDLSYNAIGGFEKNAFDEISYATEFHLEYNNLTDLSKVRLWMIVYVLLLHRSMVEFFPMKRICPSRGKIQ
jgi:hypothetical protein